MADRGTIASIATIPPRSAGGPTRRISGLRTRRTAAATAKLGESSEGEVAISFIMFCRCCQLVQLGESLLIRVCGPDHGGIRANSAWILQCITTIACEEPAQSLPGPPYSTWEESSEQV